MAHYLLQHKSKRAWITDFGLKRFVEVPLNTFLALPRLINLTLLKAGDVKEWIKFTHLTAPKDFEYQIAKVGVILEGPLDTEIDALLALHNSGAYNILKIMQNIKTPQNVLNSLNLYTVKDE